MVIKVVALVRSLVIPKAVYNSHTSNMRTYFDKYSPRQLSVYIYFDKRILFEGNERSISYTFETDLYLYL